MPSPAPPAAPFTTRAVVLSASGGTRLETLRLPAPGPGELLLRLRGCGLCGTDLYKLANGGAPPGAVLGHELIGSVEALGEGVEGLAIGDRIVVPHHVACGRCALCARGSETLCSLFRENLLEPGGFSERILVRERAVRLAARRLPDGLADEAAIFLEPAACVLRGVRRAGLPESGQEGGIPGCAVVLGAGSMGLLHVLLLRALDPDLRILVTDTLPDRLVLAEELGADAGLLASRAGEVRDAVRQATDSLGADAVFDTVGGSSLLETALALAREGGTIVLFAHAPAGERSGFDLNQLFKHERRVVGTYSGSLAEQEEVYGWLAAGRLDPSPLVTHRLPLSRFGEAVALSRARRALKVVLVPDGSSEG